ncbi:MAG: hypothetical protein WDN67_03955 [Candidatus Moraniibacteriota bacterium]
MQYLFKTFLLAAIAAASFGAPALAQQSTVSTRPDRPVSAVTRANSPIAMTPLDKLSPQAHCSSAGCHLGFEEDPSVFDGALLCMSNIDGNWAVRRDGTFDDVNPRTGRRLRPDREWHRGGHRPVLSQRDADHRQEDGGRQAGRYRLGRS